MVVNRKFSLNYASTLEIYGNNIETKPTMANGFYYNKNLDAWTEIGG